MKTGPFHNGKTRSENGKFAKGNPGGPGRPRGNAVEHFKTLRLENTTDAEFIAAWKALLKRAMAGNIQAIAILLDRCEGKVLTTVEIESNPEQFDSRQKSIDLFTSNPEAADLMIRLANLTCPGEGETEKPVDETQITPPGARKPIVGRSRRQQRATGAPAENFKEVSDE